MVQLTGNKTKTAVFISGKGSNLKYEHDKETGVLILDRILHNTNTFPYNYGYIPNTLSPDGDPVDIIVICDYKLLPGCVTNVKIIGGIETLDEKGKDDKIIDMEKRVAFSVYKRFFKTSNFDQVIY